MNASGAPRPGDGGSGIPGGARTSAGGMGLARPARGLVRILYTSNPFYLLSAELVFVGLRMSFGSGGGSWALAGGLAAYTVLLAATACVLIRLGRLWDDLRTLLLLIVMMFLAIAMSGDDLVAAAPRRGAVGCLLGFAFAVAVTEIVLATIRLRLPGWYRASYHAALALAFLYPVALVPVLGDPDNPILQWALFGFAPLAGLAVALLVPAARTGRAGVAKNGSPWPWPLYPWSLFVVLAGGLGVRAWSLCVSFHYVEGSRSIFGPYFLVPIGLAVALVWLEMGIAAGRRGVMVAASALPLILVGLAMAGDRPEWVYRQFLHRFEHALGGTPAHLTAIAAVGFLAYAAWRRVPASPELLALGLAVLAVVGPRTIDPSGLVAPRALPMAAAGLVLAARAWRRRDLPRAVASTVCLLTAASRFAGDLGGPAMTWPVALHLAVGAIMAMGLLVDGGEGRTARYIAACALGLLGLDAATGSPRIWAEMPTGLIPWYPLLIAGWAGGFAALVRERVYFASAGTSLAAWLVHSGMGTYDQLRKVVAGLDQIAWGMLFFLLAMAISFRKAGLWPRPAKACDPLLAGEAAPPESPGGLESTLDRRL